MTCKRLDFGVDWTCSRAASNCAARRKLCGGCERTTCELPRARAPGDHHTRKDARDIMHESRPKREGAPPSRQAAKPPSRQAVEAWDPARDV
jgi:hypothetical protein